MATLFIQQRSILNPEEEDDRQESNPYEKPLMNPAFPFMSTYNPPISSIPVQLAPPPTIARHLFVSRDVRRLRELKHRCKE